MDQILFAVLNGAIYGLLLFMVSAGLTLIFGMMGFSTSHMLPSI